MSKGKNSKKMTKKVPLKTAKQKRAEKKLKKAKKLIFKKIVVIIYGGFGIGNYPTQVFLCGFPHKKSDTHCRYFLKVSYIICRFRRSK